MWNDINILSKLLSFLQWGAFYLAIFAAFFSLGTYFVGQKINRLTKDETDKRINVLKNEIEMERKKIHDLSSTLELRFSGEWTESPKISILSPTNHEYYLTLKSNDSPEIKFYSTEPYLFEEINPKTLIFRSAQSVKKGSFPLGELADILSHYNVVNVLIPLINGQTIQNDKIKIETIKIIIVINARHKLKIEFSPNEICDTKKFDNTYWASCAYQVSSDLSLLDFEERGVNWE